jgi:hypothetical protein
MKIGHGWDESYRILVFREILHLYQGVWKYWSPTPLPCFVPYQSIDERNFLPYHGNKGNISPFEK